MYVHNGHKKLSYPPLAASLKSSRIPVFLPAPCTWKSRQNQMRILGSCHRITSKSTQVGIRKGGQIQTSVRGTSFLAAPRAANIHVTTAYIACCEHYLLLAQLIGVPLHVVVPRLVLWKLQANPLRSVGDTGTLADALCCATARSPSRVLHCTGSKQPCSSFLPIFSCACAHARQASDGKVFGVERRGGSWFEPMSPPTYLYSKSFFSIIACK
jgi:hypothetical protein